MDNLSEFIKKIQTEQKIQSLNEAETKQSIILPILQLLGWQVFDTDEVSPEFSIENTRVDFALRVASDNKVFIEVKRINQELEKHQEQLLAYSFKHGVQLSVLTNGMSWWFYLPLQEGSWDQRKFYTIDMYSQDFEKIGEVLSNFLAREKIANGKALKNAKSFYGNKKQKNIIQINMPIAWSKLHIEGDELLVELLAETTEKVCGYRPEDNDVSEFLFAIANQGQLKSEKPKETIKKTIKSREVETNIPSSSNELYFLNTNFTATKITGFVFLNNNISVSSWKQLLVKFVEKINSLHHSEFDIITNVSGQKKPYFTKNNNELREPQQILNTDFFVETNLSANNIVSIIRKILTVFNYNENDLKIELSKQKTLAERNVKK